MADRDELLAQFIQITACHPARARTLLTAKFVYQVSVWLFSASIYNAPVADISKNVPGRSNWNVDQAIGSHFSNEKINPKCVSVNCCVRVVCMCVSACVHTCVWESVQNRTICLGWSRTKSNSITTVAAHPCNLTHLEITTSTFALLYPQSACVWPTISVSFF